jgi:catechol 2,3-dioxygenase-like lactoylglutathione lyase family enzyme
MSVTVEAIHHVGLVVRDLREAEKFYVEVLGCRRHDSRPSWFALNANCSLHLIPMKQGEGDEPPWHAYRHVALQVGDLHATLRALLAHGLVVSQIGFDGTRRPVTSPDDPLDFGIGTLFVNDPDGNLIEFLQLGHGVFAAEQ